jgi:site-specific recombinase XerD
MHDWTQSEGCAADNFPTGIRTRGASAGRGEIVRTGYAVTLYVRHMRAAYRPATIKNRRPLLERFARETGDPALKAIKAKHVQDWLALQTCGPASLRVDLSHLRQFFRWCIEQGHLKVDPTVLIKTPRQPRRVPRALNLAELRALGDALPDARAALIVGLEYDMGLRRAEVAGLDITDIDLLAGVVLVRGKGGHERLLPLTETVRMLLQDYIAERGVSAGPLIRSQVHPSRGISPQQVGALVSRWMAEAGVKSGPRDGKSGHALRHSCAVNMSRHGVPIALIADALGHADESTTTIYTKADHSVEELRRVMGQQFIDQHRPVLAAAAEFATPRILSERDSA